MCRKQNFSWPPVCIVNLLIYFYNLYISRSFVHSVLYILKCWWWRISSSYYLNKQIYTYFYINIMLLMHERVCDPIKYEILFDFINFESTSAYYFCFYMLLCIFLCRFYENIHIVIIIIKLFIQNISLWIISHHCILLFILSNLLFVMLFVSENLFISKLMICELSWGFCG